MLFRYQMVISVLLLKWQKNIKRKHEHNKIQLIFSFDCLVLCPNATLAVSIHIVYIFFIRWTIIISRRKIFLFSTTCTLHSQPDQRDLNFIIYGSSFNIWWYIFLRYKIWFMLYTFYCFVIIFESFNTVV